MWLQILIGILVFWVIAQVLSMWFMSTDTYNRWLSKVINRSIDTAIKEEEKCETRRNELKSFQEMWKEEFEKHEYRDSN